MTLRSLLSISAITGLGLILLTAGHAQQQGQEKEKGQGKGKGQQQAQQAPAPPKSMKEALVGAWRLLIIDAVNPDKTQTPLMGPNPAGTLIFTANGQYSSQVVRTNNRVKFASNDREKGTPQEEKAAIEQIVTHFGTWSVDEGSMTLTFRIEASSFPNWDGTTQKRTITALNPNDVLTYTSMTPATGTLPIMLAWKWIP
jgi:hypothetical protein